MISFILSWSFPPSMVSCLSKLQKRRHCWKAAALHASPLQPQVLQLPELWAQCLPLSKTLFVLHRHRLAPLRGYVRLSVVCRHRHLAIDLAVVLHINVRKVMTPGRIPLVTAFHSHGPVCALLEPALLHGPSDQEVSTLTRTSLPGNRTSRRKTLAISRSAPDKAVV